MLTTILHLACVGSPGGPAAPASDVALSAEPTPGVASDIAGTSTEPTSEIVGTYYRSDGLGFNLLLDLLANGAFVCQWRGCVGEYDVVGSGTWSVSEDLITVHVEAAEGILKRRPLGDLEIVCTDDGVLLVQVDDREAFDKHGPSHSSCFNKL